MRCNQRSAGLAIIAPMRDLLFLLVHLIVIVVRLANPGGPRRVIAESVLLRHQLLILNRGRKRAPNLRPLEWIVSCRVLICQSRTILGTWSIGELY